MQAVGRNKRRLEYAEAVKHETKRRDECCNEK